MANEPTVLVTGATGRIGGQVVAQLAASGTRVRAIIRRPDTAQSEMVEGIGGDLTRPETLVPALDGIETVFLSFPSVSGDDAADDLVATLAGRARRIVYLSAFGVPEQPDPQAKPDGSILGSHAYLERLIAASATEYTFLRCSGFAANTLAWSEQIYHSDVVRWFHPDARRSLVHEADLAGVGVRALIEEVHAHRVHHLTGPEQLTQVEQLHLIGAALGRPLQFEPIEPSTAGAELFPQLPPGVAEGIVEGHGKFVSHPEPVTDTVRQILGRSPLTFAQWAREHVGDFVAAAE